MFIRMFISLFCRFPYYPGLAVQSFRMERPNGVSRTRMPRVSSKSVSPPRPPMRIMFPDKAVPRIKSNKQERRAIRRG